MIFIQIFKVGLSPSKKFVVINLNESLVKIMKNTFYFMLHFSPDFLLMQKNGLVKKGQLISTFMTSQTGQQIITRHILPNISRSKDNQTMKFAQLMEYTMKNIFLQKLYTKCGREASLRSFLEKSKLSISLDQQSKFLQFAFIVCTSRGLAKYTKTKLLTTYFYLI